MHVTFSVRHKLVDFIDKDNGKGFFFCIFEHFGYIFLRGIEVKYTEWEETHNASGIHLADNYRIPSKDSGWFKDEFIADVPFYDKKKLTAHVATN